MRHSSLFLGLVFGLLLGLTRTDRIAYAWSERPHPSTHVTAAPFSFSRLRGPLEAVIQANGMLIVTAASASAGAKRRGIIIPGNLVLGVYRNDFAVRLLKANVASSIEAPLRFYVTENTDGTATLTYRKPSAVFGVYSSAELDRMAAELDATRAKIVTQTVTK